MNSFDLKSSLLPNIHRERVLASQKVGPTYSIPYLICINPLFHLIVLYLAYYVHVFTSVFSLPLRQWRVDLRLLVSVTASPVRVLWGRAGSSSPCFKTQAICWSTAMTRPFECTASPTPPQGRRSWRALVDIATQFPVHGPLSWCFWRSRPASAGHHDTRPGRPADRAPRTPVAVAFAVDEATTRPSASPPSPATARSAGAVTSSVKPASEKRRSTLARNIDRPCKKETERKKQKVRKVVDASSSQLMRDLERFGCCDPGCAKRKDFEDDLPVLPDSEWLRWDS